MYITALICEKENAALHSVAVADVIICLSVGLPVFFIVTIMFFQRVARDMAAGRDVWAELFPALAGAGSGSGQYQQVSRARNATFINSVDEQITGRE
jgi:hypothetical protein